MCESLKALHLYLDPTDWRDVQDAVSARHALGPIPEGEGTLTARVVAEICRGWLERHGRSTDGEEVSRG